MNKNYCKFCLVLLISLFGAVNALGFDISPKNVSGEPGDTISIPVTISGITNAFEMDAVGFSMTFDPEVLTYVETDKADTLTNGFTLLAGREMTSGRVKVVGSLFGTPVSVTDDGLLVNVRFTVKGSASGNSAITLSDFKDDIAGATTTPGQFRLSGGSAADTAPPVITLKGNARMEITEGDTFTDPGATATDDTDGNMSAEISVSGDVDTNTPGTYTLTYTVTDAAGNAAEAVTRTVIVKEAVPEDIAPPVITLKGNASIEITEGGTFTDPGATATDDTDGDMSAKISVSGDVDTNTPGTYTLTYTVTDAAGNAAEAVTRTVIVKEAVPEDTAPPVITLKGNASMEITEGGTFTDPGATATDDTDGDMSANISVSGDVDTNTPGTYTLTYTVTDAAGNAAEVVTRTVIVKEAAPEDTAPPVITLKGNASMEITKGDTFTDPGATATDDTDGDVSANISVSGDVDTNTPGTYTLTYTVTDAAGNAAEAVTRTVIVKEAMPEDTTPPVITLKGNANMEITKGGTFTDPGATATDDTDGDMSANISVSGDVDTNTPGTYTLTYTVTDAAGNAAEAVTRTVIVKEAVPEDTTPPVITLNGAAVIEIEADATFTDPGATATDDTDGDISAGIKITGKVNTAAAGNYEVTYRVSDAAGNSAEKVRGVQVFDDASDPFVLTGNETHSLTTFRDVEMPNDGTVPVNLCLRTGMDADSPIIAAFPTDTKIVTSDKNAYTGKIEAPTLITPDDGVREALGKDAIAFTMGSSDTPLYFADDGAALVTITVALPKSIGTPLVWEVTSDDALILAGKDGEHNGKQIKKGGTILTRAAATDSEDDEITYEIAFLADHMSVFAVGAKVDDKGEKEGDADDSGCFIGTMRAPW